MSNEVDGRGPTTENTNPTTEITSPGDRTALLEELRATRSSEVILAEYIWTREEESQSQNALIALTSVTVVVCVAILTSLRDVNSPFNSDGTIYLSPYVWLLVPAIPSALSGWILYQAYQSLVRRAYLRCLEGSIYQTSGTQILASVDISSKALLALAQRHHDVVQPRGEKGIVALNVPAGQTLIRSLNQKKINGGSTSARGVMFFGLALFAALPILIAIISWISAFSQSSWALPYTVCGVATLAYVAFLACILRMIYAISKGSEAHWSRMAINLAVLNHRP